MMVARLAEVLVAQFSGAERQSSTVGQLVEIAADTLSPTFQVGRLESVAFQYFDEMVGETFHGVQRRFPQVLQLFAVSRDEGRIRQLLP